MHRHLRLVDLFPGMAWAKPYLQESGLYSDSHPASSYLSQSGLLRKPLHNGAGQQTPWLNPMMQLHVPLHLLHDKNDYKNASLTNYEQITRDFERP